MKKSKSKSIEDNRTGREIRRERVKEKVQDGYYAINMRELSELTGFAYSEIRKLKKDECIPFIPGSSKFFYDDFRLSICRRYGIDKGAADSPSFAKQLVEWVKKNSPNGGRAPAYLIEEIQMRVKTIMRTIFAEYGVRFPRDTWTD